VNGTGGVEPSGYPIRELGNYMLVREIGCEDGKWMELAQDRVQWWPFILVVLNL
jgi:hypothetical protein